MLRMWKSAESKEKCWSNNPEEAKDSLTGRGGGCTRGVINLKSFQRLEFFIQLHAWKSGLLP